MTRPPLWSLLWPALLLAMGIVALFAQLDRKARYAPHFAEFVPSAFASFSQHHHAQRAVMLNAPDAGLAEARRLAAIRPIPAEHLRLLARAQINSDAGQSASGVIEQAALRGWRDQATQEAMLLLALNADDREQAAWRLAALWALANDLEALRRYSPPILSNAEARGHFARVLAQARWRRNFLAKGPAALPTHVFEQSVHAAILAGARFDCARLRTAMDRAGSGEERLSQLMAAAKCPNAR